MNERIQHAAEIFARNAASVEQTERGFNITTKSGDIITVRKDKELMVRCNDEQEFEADYKEVIGFDMLVAAFATA